MNNDSIKLALAHDDLVQSGGAERVVAALHGLYPKAPLYTSIYDPRTTLASLADADIRTSYIQQWPLACRKLHKLALTAYPVAFEEFDFSGYDVVISSASRFAKGIITPPETCHICYCHTPSRFAWRTHEYLAQSRTTRILAPLLRNMLSRLRALDFVSAQRPDFFIANSVNVAKRIRKYYRREPSAVIYPPIETKRFSPVAPNEVGDHYLVVSRLVGHKRIDLAVEACTKLGLPLKVVGGGPEEKALKKVAGPTVSFLGWLSDEDVAIEYARCKAFIFPGEDDFGMTPVECMASGRPVIGFGRGGALESIVEGRTGLFFHKQTVDSLANTLVDARSLRVLPEVLQAHAARFDVAEFNRQMENFVRWATQEHRGKMNAFVGPQIDDATEFTMETDAQFTRLH